MCQWTGTSLHDDVIKLKHFPRYFVRGIHRPPVNSPHKGQWRGAFKFFFICTWINGWVYNGEAGDLRRYRAHYDVIVMGSSNVCVLVPNVRHDITWPTVDLWSIGPRGTDIIAILIKVQHFSLNKMCWKYSRLQNVGHFVWCIDRPCRPGGHYRDYYHGVKSLYLIWKTSTRRFHLLKWVAETWPNDGVPRYSSSHGYHTLCSIIWPGLTSR